MLLPDRIFPGNFYHLFCIFLQVVVLKESGNKLLRKLFENGNNNKLNVASHAATIGHSNKMRVSIASSKQMSATSPASKQHKKTVGVANTTMEFCQFDFTFFFYRFS